MYFFSILLYQNLLIFFIYVQCTPNSQSSSKPLVYFYSTIVYIQFHTSFHILIPKITLLLVLLQRCLLETFVFSFYPTLIVLLIYRSSK